MQIPFKQHVSRLRRRSATRLIGAATVYLLLSACMVGPDYRRPDLTLNDRYQTVAEAVPVTAAGASPESSIDQWWQGFDDPVLTRIVGRVLAGNLDLAAAQARVTQARAAARGAGADLLPEGSLDGSVARQRQSAVGAIGTLGSHLPGYNRNQTFRQLGAGASWELDLAGGLHRRAEALRDEADAAEAAGLGTRISMVAEAADAYFQGRAAQAQLAFLTAQISADDELVRVIDERVREGVAIDRELDDVKAQQAEDRALLPALRTQLQAEGNRLDVLMGAALGTNAAALGDEGLYPWTMPGIPGSVRPAQLLRRRPDIIAAERHLAAATASIGVALSQYYPDVSISALLGFERLNAGDLFSGAAFQPAMLAGVHWRLFDFGRVDAEVAQARGAEAEALAQCRQAVLRAAEDAEDALLALAEANARTREWQAVVDANARAGESVQRSQEAGTASRADILKRQRELLEVRRGWVLADSERARATVDAFRALGGGWESEAAPRYGMLSDIQ